MSVVAEEVGLADLASVPSEQGLFSHPLFIEFNRTKAADLVVLRMQPPQGPPWTVFPAEVRGRSCQLTFSASFTHLALPSPTLYDALDIADALIEWGRRRDLESLSITLPPHVYGAWVPLMAFALRARGFASTALRLSPILTFDALRQRTDWSENLRRSVKALDRASLRVRAPDDPADALAFIASAYAARDREMSAGEAELCRYVAHGLPVLVLDVIDRHGARVFAVVFYGFGPVLLYMFSGRAPGLRQSPFAWLLAQLPELDLPGRPTVLDLGAAGHARPDFDFRGNGVIRFKAQLAPVYDYRETLCFRAEEPLS